MRDSAPQPIHTPTCTARLSGGVKTFFLLSVARRAIFVGITHDLPGRLAQCCTLDGKPAPLLGFLYGSHAQGIAAQFAASSIGRHWFRDTPELRAAIHQYALVPAGQH